MSAPNLTTLSLAERLHTMELLWTSLDDTAQQAMPRWHQGVVTQRLQRLREGFEAPAELDEAFDRIANNIAARRSGPSSAE
jgi:hypothetical protein